MQQIKFSTNWNKKLDCDFFTTIRIFDNSKHFKNNVFEVLLKDHFFANVQVVDVYRMLVEDLTDYCCYLDTGYNKTETINILKKMYPRLDFTKKYFALIMLKKIDLKP